jgi:hypothetical protein
MDRLNTQSIDSKDCAPETNSETLQPSGIILNELSRLIDEYMRERPRLSLSVLSQKSKVSEPTLRRIRYKKFKTLPTPTTIVNLLTYISGKTQLNDLVQTFPGPLGEYLQEILPQSQQCNPEYNQIFEEEFEDNNRYLIYKLSSNDCGVSRERIQRLLGTIGLDILDDMINKGLIVQKGKRYHSQTESFALSPEKMKKNFRFLSNFLKTDQTETPNSLLKPMSVNYSSSVSPATYKKIMKLQKKTLHKIRDLMVNDPESGDIPVLLLMAIDTLDTKLPSEDFSED